MKIIFDSGIRTGADVFKAIALGAHAVQVGRLYLWGMSHEGESGCRHVMKSLLAVSRICFSSGNEHLTANFLMIRDLDILMTVAGYRSITNDVTRQALRYNPHGTFPAPREHAKL